jgi:hypothetical protein
MGKKRVVIGITVNLEHYENLRLEVEGEAGDPEEAAGLVAFLDELLDRFGEGDAEVRKRIENYRQRVLPARSPDTAQKPAKAAAGKKKAPETGKKVEQEGEEEPIEAPPTTEGDLPELLYHKPADAGCVPEGPHRPGGEGVCEIGEVCESVVPEPPAVSAKEAAKKEPAVGLVCSRCGAAITRQQEQLSQLFVGKALCRQCMDAEE